MTNRIVDTQCTKKIERPALKSLKNSPLPNSILSPEDHIFYLDCLKSNQLSSTEMKRFHQLQTLVAKEKEVYRIYQQAITTMDKEKFERCSEPAERLFLEKIQERKSRVFFNYSSNIKHLKSLFFATEYNDNPALTFGQTIAKTGNLLKLNLLPIKTDLKLRSTTERKSIMPVISEDMKIPPMLKDKDIDVCISSSTLETLISSFGTNSDAYEIPVKIVVNGLGTTVLIDNSLPLPKLNNREKMTQYLKMATLNQLMDGVSQNNPTIWYNHWTFGNLKLLIRTNLLGIQKTNRVATVKCKLEYQIEKGYEVLDDSTRINWWASHYIRPNAELWVANLNPINESIIRFDKIPSIDIIPNREWPIPFINALYSILTEVKSLPVGQYYLSKDYGARSVDILKSVQTKTERPFPLCSLVNYPRHVYTWPMVEWKGPPSQIPFTFPPSSEGQRKSKLAIPLWFCKIFKLKNRCNRQLCPYSHLTKRELRILFDQDDSRFIPSSGMNERESNKCNMKRRKQPEDRSKRTKLESAGWKDADAASNSLNDVLQYD
ncbi:hypothetical protein BC833DRAFT_571157 [Globomyces pollinis-pini]|nr:hypothetical protein BC833DRAFT_571157 [Globomyces pollinis-pini]